MISTDHGDIASHLHDKIRYTKAQTAEQELTATIQIRFHLTVKQPVESDQGFPELSLHS